MRGVRLQLVALACVTAALWAEGAQRRTTDGTGRRRAHRVQHGQCSYTFVLPEAEPPPCQPPEAPVSPNTLQRDAPASDWPVQRVQQLERVLENNTQWLLKVRGGHGGKHQGKHPDGMAMAGGVQMEGWRATGLPALIWL